MGGVLNQVPGLQIEAALAHLAAADAIMADLAARHAPESAYFETGDLFRSLTTAIVSQQLSAKAADTIIGRLEATLAPAGGVTPEGVLATSHEALRAAGLSNAKARYLRSLAETVLAGEIELQCLHELEDEAVVEQLTRVKGIGRWTAEMFLIFSLGRPDVLSTGDFGIRSAVRRLYGLPALPTPDELRTIAAPWRPYTSTALLLLWRSQDSAPPISSADGGVS
jgi:DNA-3-methyladenine glycosylase II